MKRILAAAAPLLALVFCAATAHPANIPDSPAPSGATVKTFVYKVTPQGALRMEVHFPPDWAPDGRRPAIVFFFGGGWHGGSAEQFERQADYLAGRGMIAARADYRVRSRHGTPPADCVEDAKSAVRWLRKHAAELGIDPDRIASAGGSAGGHLAAACFTAEGLDAPGEDRSISPKPNLMVLFNPVLNTSVEAQRKIDFMRAERYLARMGSAEAARKISPNDSLTADVPPAIIFFGADDALIATGREFVQKAKELGLTAKLYVAGGARHGFFNQSPYFERTLWLADKFLSEHGYLEGEPSFAPAEGEMELEAPSP